MLRCSALMQFARGEIMVHGDLITARKTYGNNITGIYGQSSKGPRAQHGMYKSCSGRALQDIEVNLERMAG